MKNFAVISFLLSTSLAPLNLAHSENIFENCVESKYSETMSAVENATLLQNHISLFKKMNESIPAETKQTLLAAAARNKIVFDWDGKMDLENFYERPNTNKAYKEISDLFKTVKTKVVNDFKLKKVKIGSSTYLLSPVSDKLIVRPTVESGILALEVSQLPISTDNPGITIRPELLRNQDYAVSELLIFEMEGGIQVNIQYGSDFLGHRWGNGMVPVRQFAQEYALKACRGF